MKQLFWAMLTACYFMTPAFAADGLRGSDKLAVLAVRDMCLEGFEKGFVRHTVEIDSEEKLLKRNLKRLDPGQSIMRGLTLSWFTENGELEVSFPAPRVGASSDTVCELRARVKDIQSVHSAILELIHSEPAGFDLLYSGKNLDATGRRDILCADTIEGARILLTTQSNKPISKNRFLVLFRCD